MVWSNIGQILRWTFASCDWASQIHFSCFGSSRIQIFACGAIVTFKISSKRSKAFPFLIELFEGFNTGVRIKNDEKTTDNPLSVSKMHSHSLAECSECLSLAVGVGDWRKNRRYFGDQDPPPTPSTIGSETFCTVLTNYFQIRDDTRFNLSIHLIQQIYNFRVGVCQF